MRPTAQAPLAAALLVVTALGSSRGQDAAPATPTSTDAPPPAAEVAPATDLPVSVEAALGFGNRVPADGFLSVAIDLTNRGATTNAQVIVRAEEGGNVLLRLGPIELEGGVRRRVIGVVPAKPVLEAGTLTFAVTDPEGRLLGAAQVSPEATPARLLVALDRRGGAPSDLSTLRTIEGLGPNGQPNEVRWTAVVVSRLEDLPQSPLGYSGLGAVLLGDLDLESWPEPEARALAAWVARGGNLVVSVGPRARLLRGRSLLGKFLGGALKPLPEAPPERDVPLDELVRKLRGTYGLDAGDPAGAPPAPALATLLPGPDDVVVQRANDKPFIVRRRHGLGQVTLVAADLWAPPFLHSSLTARLLETLLSNGTSHSPRSQLLFKELAGVRQPARVGPAFAVLILYALIVGPGVYFVLRAKKRGILLWLAIPIGTVICTALVPLYRIVLRDAESTLVGVRLIEGWSGQPLTVETTDVLLFSGSLDAKRFEYKGDDAAAFAVVPPRRRGAPDLGAVLGGGPDGAAFSLPVALWGTRYVSFEASGAAVAGEGAVRLSLPGPGDDPTGAGEPVARLSLRWDGPTLRDAFVLYPGSAVPLAHKLTRELARGDALDEPLRAVSPQSIEGRESDLGGLVVEDLLASSYIEATDRERKAFLIGQLDSPPPLRALPNVRTRALATIVVVELPVVYEDAVPYGVARVVREGSTVAAVGSGTVEREVRTRLLLPTAQGRTAAQAQLQVTAQRVRSVLRLRIDAFDWRADDWVALLPREEGDEEREGAGRRIELPLEDPARFVSADGAVLLRQRFLRGRQDSDDVHAAIIDVSVEWEKRD